MKPVYAAITNPAVSGLVGADPSTAGSFLGNLITTLLEMMIIVGALGALLYIILGGIRWVSAGGDKQGLEEARGRITNGIIGLVIIVGGWAIMLFVSGILGLDFPNISFPSISGVTTSAGSSSSFTFPSFNLW